MTSTGPAIQWFPGHMAKTRRIMKENLKHVDIVVELRDARIPYASENPEIQKLVENKPRVILLTKADLADTNITKYWCLHFIKKEIPALAVDARSGKGLEQFFPMVREKLKDLVAARNAKGMVGAPIRMMIVGIPNVGKSSLINRMAKGKPLQVEDRPGVTLRKQWIKVDGGVELLDMPGVLWPRFEDKTVGEHLAFTGAIKDDIIDVEWIAMQLMKRLHKDFSRSLITRFKFTQNDIDSLDNFQLVELLGRKRGMLVSGGEIDFERASLVLLDEFRSGLLGRISLEAPLIKGDSDDTL